jgi:hypothetical protein
MILGCEGKKCPYNGWLHAKCLRYDMTEEEVNERGKYLCDKCKGDGPNFPLCPNLPIKMLSDSFDSEISEFSHSSFRKKPIIA